MKITVIIHHR